MITFPLNPDETPLSSEESRMLEDLKKAQEARGITISLENGELIFSKGEEETRKPISYLRELVSSVILQEEPKNA